MTPDELHRALRHIHCTGMADALETRIKQAQSENLRPVEMLELLVHDELQCRRDRALERRVKRARFRDFKTLDTFDWEFNRTIDKRLIEELSTCKFIEQKISVVMVGNSGTGKSHLVQGLGYAAAYRDFTVLYKENILLCNELAEAHLRGEAYHTAFLKKLTSPSLLIIEDIALKQTSPQVAQDLVDIIMMRYERAATIVTSNRLPGDWTEYFGNIPSMMVFVDRMLHGYVIEVKGDSYRLAQSVKRHQEHQRFSDSMRPFTAPSPPPLPPVQHQSQQREEQPPPKEEEPSETPASQEPTQSEQPAPRRPIIVDESRIPIPALKPVDRFSPRHRGYNNNGVRPSYSTQPRNEV